jgi:uncharacterized membrane protein
VSTQTLSPARLEAFSDGVIAVIITIMVLELKVPALDGWAGVRMVWPTVFLYLLTFVQVGIYWVNHHYLIDECGSVGHGILWANLMFLFCLSLFPFVTSWIGAKGLSSFSTALYAGVSLLPGVCYALLSGQVRKQSAVPPHATMSKQITSIVLYLLAIPVAYYRASVSLALICAVALMWLQPPKVETGEADSWRAPSGKGAQR